MDPAPHLHSGQQALTSDKRQKPAREEEIVKGNTPATRADLELFFEDEQADRRTWQSWEHVEQGHGRLERRSIITTPDLND